MRLKVLSAVLLTVSLIFAGCGPIESLFALYTSDDKFFDENLVGEWRQVSPSDDESSKNRWVFLRDGDMLAYKVSLSGLGKTGGGFLSTGHLVKLGGGLFIDFEPDSSAFDDGSRPIPYPTIDCHMIARIWIEKDAVRIHFLSEDWVKAHLREGKLSIGYAGAKDGPILNVPTPDLRRFVLEHAEDQEAFSDNYDLARLK